jgi:hypothetical protein
VCASVRIRPFCGAGPFQLVDPHAPPLPFPPTAAATSSLLTTTPLPPPSHCLTTSRCLFVVNSSRPSLTTSRLAILHGDTFAPTNQSGQIVPH